MNPNAMRRHRSVTAVCRCSTFYSTSARKPDDGHASPNAPTHALNAGLRSASLPAVDFDAVKNYYYKGCGNVNVPCSVDAVTFERDGVYLIEFKCGGADQGQLFRKIYDSLMLLIEYDNYTFNMARADVHYIVVSAKLPPWSATMKTLSRACGFCKEPWNRYQKYYDHWGLVPLEGVVVNSAYTMPPDMFDYFTKYKRWK